VVSRNIITGSMVVLTFCIVHVCCGLCSSLDAFCVLSSNDQDLRRMSFHWNVLQATHRECVHKLKTCLLLQGTTTIAPVLWMTLDALRSQGSSLRSHIEEGRCVASWCGQTLLPTVLLLFTILCAGMVSEKCSRVPSFVNEWTLEDGCFKHDSQALVQYITQSQPGFYVKGARLSTITGVKLAYVLGVVMFTVTQSTFGK